MTGANAHPWSELPVLQDLCALLRTRLSGREVFRVAVGPNWLRLHFVGDERPGLVLSSRPGSNYTFPVQGTWSDAIKKALPVAKGHILGQQLTGSTLLHLGALPDDRIIALHFLTQDGSHLYVLHQLFGQRGNTTLLDHQNRLLWARHQIPHTLLTEIPTPETWQSGQATDAREEYFQEMRLLFKKRLAQDVFTQYHAAINKSNAACQRLVENLKQDLETANQGDQFRRWAEALAANLHLLKQGQETADIMDLQDGTPISIPLNPALSPAVNMQHWFRKASKADKGRQTIADNFQRNARLLHQQQNALEQLTDLALVEDDETKLSQLHQWAADHQELLPRPKPASQKRKHGPEEATRPFRRYLIEDKWEAWVGRNNKENDELTHRASHSKDIWMHAQGVAGSHVILRTAGKPEQIPRTVLVKAAALAALHCKAKHSKLVPVIYTEKRYVRKPRKSPPGLAVCIQEKSIDVQPGVAEGVCPI
ncbi:MAG: DUF814 domain-containing protein [bacterium]|nr:DUF814 domain-containing protein [bacterium]